MPPNAAAIAQAGAGFVVADSPEAVAAGIENLLTDEKGWRTASRRATEYAKQFDWNVILSETLDRLGFR